MDSNDFGRTDTAIPPGSDNDTTAFDIPVESLSVSDLLLLRQRIDAKLPATSLSELNLEQELVIQFMSVKELLNDVSRDVMTPANQKAQVINSLSSVLLQMTKSQTDLYNAERIKKIERAVIEVLGKISQKLAEEFLESYEKHYTGSYTDA